jgi:iron complex transport system substrate-binding protein
MKLHLPERIICMTEETTEWLYLLGQSARIVGISGYTVRPKIARAEKPRISAFTSAKIDKILALEPDGTYWRHRLQFESFSIHASGIFLLAKRSSRLATSA